MKDMYKTYDLGDYCLRTSLYCYSCVKNGRIINIEDKELMDHMEIECKLDPLSLFPRKSEYYKWSNSDGLTRFIYNFFLRFLGIDPYKGLNFDQLRAYYLYLYATKQRKKAIKHLAGWFLRLGFAPSLMEHIIFKPQAIIMLLATIWYPLHYLVYIPFIFSVRKNMTEPIEVGTTNKITLLPTLKELKYLDVGGYIVFIEMLGYKYAYFKDYVIDVYRTYFAAPNLVFIADSMIDKVMRKEEK